MKRILSAVVFGSMALTSVAAFADSNTQLVPVAAQVFAPPGFDSNDNAQIVFQSYLPNTCYKSAAPAVKVDQDNHKIYLRPQAYFQSGVFCLELWTPYVRTVDLGILATGSYDIYEIGANGTPMRRGSLPIAEAPTGNTDDFLYAPIKSATIDKSSGKPMLTLSGVFTSDCAHLKEVRVMYRTSHIVEVLPIAEVTSQSCAPGSVPFSKTVELPSVGVGATLIYIRSLGGQAINLVEDI